MLSVGAVPCAARGPMGPGAQELLPHRIRTNPTRAAGLHPCARMNPSRRAIRMNPSAMSNEGAAGLVTRADERTQAPAQWWAELADLGRTNPTRPAGPSPVRTNRRLSAGSERTRALTEPTRYGVSTNEPERQAGPERTRADTEPRSAVRTTEPERRAIQMKPKTRRIAWELKVCAERTRGGCAIGAKHVARSLRIRASSGRTNPRGSVRSLSDWSGAVMA
jgi:hypothetical protein